MLISEMLRLRRNDPAKCARGGFVLLVAATALAGCASPMTAADKATFATDLDAGNYKAAEEQAIQAGAITPDGRTTNVVWGLNAGAAELDAGDPKAAVATLDTTEKLAQGNDLDHMKGTFDYQYTTYDGVMTNLYKAMAFLVMNDPDDARVEFNRAEDRQRRAEATFKDQIARAEAAQAPPTADYRSMMAKAEQSTDYASATEHLSQLAVYTPFENPFATYLGGIFFINQPDDYRKGVVWLQRASQELGPNSPATADLIWADHSHRSLRDKPLPQIWVVFENGQSATYHEIRLVLPTIAGTPMTLAMPTLVENEAACPFIVVQAGGISVNTLPAGSFDAVMASEFQRRRPVILAHAITEVLAKNVGSAVAAKSNSGFLKLAMLVANNVSTADTRSWIALPKEFQTVRVAAPENGEITLATSDGQALGTVKVPTDRSSIVWVKLQHLGAHPAINVAPL
jgi:hypothetical protein